MEASAGPWRCLSTLPGTCGPSTRARPAGGACGGDAVPTAPSGMEASARNSVCPEP